jgi:hypothetical protein
MVGAVCEDVKRVKSERFATIRESALKARKLELDMLHNYAGQGLFGELRNICSTLLRIAQRYVPATPTAFADATAVVKCAKMMEGLALQPALEAKFAARVTSATDIGVLNSFEYRYLRSKSIAGFATIADLTCKPVAVGSLEYQNGVREGYRRASEIAILFLDDVQSGSDNGSTTRD